MKKKQMEKNSLMRMFRRMHKLQKLGIPFLPMMIHKYIRIIYSCDLPPQVKIGTGSLFVHNGLGCVIHRDAIIGSNVKIYQNVSIAGRNGRGTPIIKDNVFIGAGACILGGVTIGNNAIIGANAVVISDIKAGATVVGVPAKETVKK